MKENLRSAIEAHVKMLENHYGHLRLNNIRQVAPTIWEGTDKYGCLRKIGYGLSRNHLTGLGINESDPLTMWVQYDEGGQWWDAPPIEVYGPGITKRITTTEELIKFLEENIIPDGTVYHRKK